jgi:hypothetical protein
MKLLCFEILMLALCLSCSDVYDNIKDFSMKERIYPAHFDTIFAEPGYERVEIDLCKEGRLPASLMYLGKAQRTLVEYDAVSKTYDSVCSWLNITGLTLPKLYRFRVYTVDEYDNRSTPMEVALTPYTAEDRSAMAVPNPNMFTISNFVVAQWTNGISSDIMDYLHLEYSYQDKNGNTRTGSTRNTEFFLANMKPGEETSIDMTYWVYPKIGGKRILDSVSFKGEVRATLDPDATPVEFAVSPKRMALLRGKSKVAVPNIQYGLTWTSSNPQVATVNSSGVILARSVGTAVITVKTEALPDTEAQLTVVVPDVSAYPQGDKLAGVWTFEDAADLVKASVGADLEPAGSSFTSIAGPGNTRAVRIAKPSYYGVRHEMLPTGGGKNVNEYTMMMDIRIPAQDYTAWKSLFNTWPENTSAGVVWSNNGDIGKAVLGGQSAYGALQPDTWHRVVFVAQLATDKRSDAFIAYVDGEQVWEATQEIGLDGMLSFYTDLMYVGTEDMGRGYPGPDLAELRLWSVRLKEAEIEALGGF